MPGRGLASWNGDRRSFPKYSVEKKVTLKGWLRGNQEPWDSVVSHPGPLLCRKRTPTCRAHSSEHP